MFKTIRRLTNDIRWVAISNAHDYYYDWETPSSEPIPFTTRIYFYVDATRTVLGYTVGTWVCRLFGHARDTQVEHHGEWGRCVSWFCPRCGQGGDGSF